MNVVKLGSDLKVGDVLEVWGPSTVYRITGLEPYAGPLAHLWPEGVWTASLAGAHLKALTVGANDRFTVYE